MLFAYALGHLRTFIISDPFYRALADQLRASERATWEAARLAVQDVDAGTPRSGRLRPQSIEAQAAACLGLIEGLAEYLPGDEARDPPFLEGAFRFITGLDPGRSSENKRQVIRDVAVKGLVDYLDERTTTQAAALHLLRKYKQRSERFHRERLRDIAARGIEGRRAGERALAYDVHSYLFDQGADFVVEPESASGRVDIVLTDSTNDSLVVEAKYIRPEDRAADIRRKFGHGLHQVTRYCGDRAVRTGHLVLFLNHEAQLDLPLEDQNGLLYFPLGSNLVFITEIRIGASPSASRAGAANEISLTREEVLSAVQPTPEDESGEAGEG
jgi:hypothetical protein